MKRFNHEDEGTHWLTQIWDEDGLDDYERWATFHSLKYIDRGDNFAQIIIPKPDVHDYLTLFATSFYE